MMRGKSSVHACMNTATFTLISPVEGSPSMSKMEMTSPTCQLDGGNKISSLVVGNRCTLKIWSKSGKTGNNRSFNAGVVYQLKDYTNGLFGNWNDAISSYYCTCT
ncbi:unnamed protein product [Staurois parvus]|uniref:Uncharacterized protein n=1 Tax=Staurois parvus TaxID=386267 RepID=A0ABN9ACK7_9NEOB|nr:unnamed protein product [Staurois parvus]